MADGNPYIDELDAALKAAQPQQTAPSTSQPSAAAPVVGTPPNPPPPGLPDYQTELTTALATPTSPPSGAASASLPPPGSDLPFRQRPPTGDFTGEVVSSIPIVGKLPALGAAAVKASTDYLLGGSDSPSWYDLYRQRVEQLQAPQRQWAQEHPYQRVAADALGGVLGAVPLGAAARAIIPASSRLISQFGTGAALGGAGGAAQETLDPNATWGDVATGGATGAVTGATTAVPGLLSAAKQSGLTLKELGEIGTRISLGLVGGEHFLGPWGKVLALPGALQAGWDLIKMAGQKVPSWAVRYAPAAGAEGARVVSGLLNDQPNR